MALDLVWSRQEVEACVAAYLRMLTLELNGQHYSKTEHGKALLRLLNSRSRQSIEFKHCNISAVLIELGYPYIRGYKRRGNFQKLLLAVVEAHLEANPELQAAAQDAVLRPVAAPPAVDPNKIWSPAPKPTRVREVQVDYQPLFSPARRDYLAQESRNRSLGRAGELLVLEVEARRLHTAGKKTLSERVEHVAETQGDGLGFDILSFENSGKERLIEVKTTSFGEATPFYVTRNELARSERDSDQFHVYRVFDFRRQPRIFDLPGAISTHCDLDAVSYIARLDGI